jgi:hypothetical protein
MLQPPFFSASRHRQAEGGTSHPPDDPLISLISKLEGLPMVLSSIIFRASTKGGIEMIIVRHFEDNAAFFNNLQHTTGTCQIDCNRFLEGNVFACPGRLVQQLRRQNFDRIDLRILQKLLLISVDLDGMPLFFFIVCDFSLRVADGIQAGIGMVDTAWLVKIRYATTSNNTDVYFAQRRT